jgi:hydroxypyruvate reductase
LLSFTFLHQGGNQRISNEHHSRKLNLKNIAQRIFERTLAAIDVESVVGASVCLSGHTLIAGATACDLARVSRVIVIGIGKASVAMARAIENILGERITDGLVVTNAVTGAAPQRLRVMIGGHPVPNEQSVAAAEAALQLLRATDNDDTLVIFLISGGGSTLFEKPVSDSITLDDLQQVNRVLVGCGAVIGEMNVVRRYLSVVKGGGLAAAAARSQQLSLYISDVNSDDLATIASGPTIAGKATCDDFERILARYDLPNKFPPNVTALIKAGKVRDSDFSLPVAENQFRAHYLLLDNQSALIAAKDIAENEFNCVVEIAADLVEGEVEMMARAHLERLAALRARHAGKAVCLLSGGEVICPVRGRGQGGRNQEFVLRAAMHLSGENIVVLSAGTDGIDGASPAAGAVADGETVSRALAMKIQPRVYCLNSDSFSFFNALGDAIITGPTGNNVRDLRILLAP